MSGNNIEYCKFILSKDTFNNNMYIELDNEYLKDSFLEELENLIDSYKRIFDIKEEKFSYDTMVLETIEEFLRPEILFVKHKYDIKLKKLFIKTQEMFIKEKKSSEDGKGIIFDNIFEIVINMLLLLSNTIVCIEVGQKEITCKTTEIDIKRSIVLIEGYKKIDQRSARREKYLKREGKIIEKIPQPLFVASLGAISIWPVGFFAAWSIIIKMYFDSHRLNRDSKEEYRFYYFMYMIMASYTRNEEIKEKYGYGW